MLRNDGFYIWMDPNTLRAALFGASQISFEVLKFYNDNTFHFIEFSPREFDTSVEIEKKSYWLNYLREILGGIELSILEAPLNSYFHVNLVAKGQYEILLENKIIGKTNGLVTLQGWVKHDCLDLCIQRKSNSITFDFEEMFEFVAFEY